MNFKDKIKRRLKKRLIKQVKAKVSNPSFSSDKFVRLIGLLSKTRFKKNIRRFEGGFLASQDLEKAIKRVFPGFRFFDETIYLKLNPDVDSAVIEGKLQSCESHFFRYGLFEMATGRRVFSLPIKGQLLDPDKISYYFEPEQYLRALERSGYEVPDKSLAESHFFSVGVSLIFEGKIEALKDNVYYEHESYLHASKDINASILLNELHSPLEHFLLVGKHELCSGKRLLPNSHLQYDYQQPNFDDLNRSTLDSFHYKPLISVVMPVYNVDPKWLELAYQSLNSQWYQKWELCICDDASTNEDTKSFLNRLESSDSRVKVVFSDKNENISAASNKALSLVTGDFVALMDNDDELTPDALFEVVKVLQNRNITFCYSDEDKIELSGRYVEPHFKPDYSVEMFLCHNYISHLGVIRRDLIDKVNGWRLGYEGAQDYDLYLRVSELEDFNPHHIPKVLYHWRKIPGSTASEFGEKSYANDAGKMSLESALDRRGIAGSVDYGISLGTYKINYDIVEGALVSIVIPFKDKPELLRSCLDSIYRNDSAEVDFEVICVDNQSSDPEIFSIKKEYSELYDNLKFIKYDFKFNYSAINNYAVENFADGDYILLLNNDIEILHKGWLKGMLEYAQHNEVGAVGVKLHYPNNTIQHAGVVLTPNTTHGVFSAFQGQPSNANGYFSRLNSVCNYSCVTAAMLMVSKEKYWSVGGLDENLAVAYNDVDFCLQLDARGYRNVYTPYVEAIHHESISRGYEDSIEKLDRLGREMQKLKTKNSQYFTSTDRFFNPNLSDDTPSFDLGRFVVRGAEKLTPIKFQQNIIHEKVFDHISSNEKLCIFSHFDDNDIIDDTVIYYINELSKRYKIVFISTSEGMCISELNKLKSLVSVAIVKSNFGYDFGAWKTGIDYLGKKLETADELLLCNDSVYGPFNTFSSFYNIVDSKDFDVVGLLDNYEINYHLQSYFISYSSTVINSSVFKNFWSDFIIYIDKRQIVIENEIGFCNKLLEAGYRMTSLAKSEKIAYVNNAHRCWRELIELYDFPFIKRELVKKNPLQVDLSDCRKVLKSKNSYLLSLVEKHMSKSL